MNYPQVVIVGAGFAGINAVKALASYPVEVTLIDKKNYHTFYPLLYQVSAAELTSEQIAFPIRSFLRKYDDTDFILGEVTGLDRERNFVVLDDQNSIPYDYLILATGSKPFFFGTPGAEQHCMTIDTLQNGEKLRSQVLASFEKATRVEYQDRKKELLRFVIIGAGPTGVEYAAALAELIDGPLRKDFPHLDMTEVEIILVDALNSVLPRIDADKIQQIAKKRLHDLGVTIRLNAEVDAVTEERVKFKNGDAITAETKIWTAGVTTSPIFKEWGLPVTDRGDIIVQDTLQLTDSHNEFAIGDIARLENSDPLPKLAPVAIQQGEVAGKNIGRLVTGKPLKEFTYADRGSLIVLGRYRAVAKLGDHEFGGVLAWLIWGLVHIYYLIGFRRRLLVFINWLWDLFRFEKVERLITTNS